MRKPERKYNYIAPQTEIVSGGYAKGVLLTESLPVDPGEEGNQEDAEVKVMEVEWGNLWEEDGLWNKQDLWEER